MNSPFVSEKYIKLEALKTFLFSYQEVWLLYLMFTTYSTTGAKQSPPALSVGVLCSELPEINHVSPVTT